MSMTVLAELAQLVEEQALRKSFRRFFELYPEEGPLRRELYPRHMSFFSLGRNFRIRAFMAANRVGKTEGGGGYETVCHLTGMYPAWWPGHQFKRPIDCWVAGDTKETVRDITQHKLFGPREAIGTGLVPKECIGDITWRANSNGAMDQVRVLHKPSGRWSTLGFKSYDQGRTSFQGTEKDLIWLDEEAPEEVRDECMIRLMTTKGHLLETFTPLKGITKVVQQYMGEGAETDTEWGVTVRGANVMVNAGWDHVPHLNEDDKRILLANSLPYLADARSKGTPSLGAGAIYPVPESEIVVPDFVVPAHWPRAYGMDVGWNKTAATWGAIDRESDVVYLYSEYARGEVEPVVHAQAIKARGSWIPGAIDPAARGRGQDAGKKLLDMYVDLGLDLTLADNAVEPGLLDVWMRLSTGRLKVFKSLQKWLTEYRMYRRDEKGKIVKQDDHAMDTTRYLARTGLAIARVRPVSAPEVQYNAPLDPLVGY